MGKTKEKRKQKVAGQNKRDIKTKKKTKPGQQLQKKRPGDTSKKYTIPQNTPGKHNQHPQNISRPRRSEQKQNDLYICMF